MRADYDMDPARNAARRQHLFAVCRVDRPANLIDDSDADVGDPRSHVARPLHARDADVVRGDPPAALLVLLCLRGPTSTASSRRSNSARANACIPPLRCNATPLTRALIETGGIGLKVSTSERPILHPLQRGSSGLVPMLRVFDATARYVDQGGGSVRCIRHLSGAVHADVEAFLGMKNHGTQTVPISLSTHCNASLSDTAAAPSTAMPFTL